MQIQKDRFASGLANCKGAMLSTMEGFWLNGTPRRSAFPSVRIEAGKRGAKAQKGFKTDIETTSASGGHVFTMASLVWLILYMLSPNYAQGKAGVKQRIAERSFAMLQVLAKIAYKGHAAGSASASISGDLTGDFTLKANQGSADVCVDGELRMDWRGLLVAGVSVDMEPLARARHTWQNHPCIQRVSQCLGLCKSHFVLLGKWYVKVG